MSTFQLKEGRRRVSSTPTIPPNTVYLEYFNFFTHFPPHPIPAPGFWKTPIFTLLLWVLIHKWDHIIFIFPGSIEAYLCCYKSQFPFYDWTAFHCICIHHIFFFQSSADGNTGCFCVLAIINNTFLWTWWGGGCKYLFDTVISFPWDIFELLDSMVVLFLIFWRTSITFSTVAIPTYIFSQMNA